MSTAVCPYCRDAIEQDDRQAVVCQGCGTPHHGDCFEENGGCTVFGCTAAPPAEPKVSVGVPELQGGVDPQAPAPAVTRAAPPPMLLTSPPGVPRGDGPPMFNSWGYNLLAHPLPEAEQQTPPMFSSLGYGCPQPIPYPVPTPLPIHVPDPSAPTKSRTTFLLLGVLFGGFGAHSFYAGSTKKGLLQLAITLFTFGFAGLMVWIWAITDICTITSDNNGIPFRN